MGLGASTYEDDSVTRDTNDVEITITGVPMFDRAIATGQHAADNAHATERRADVQNYADQFIKMGVGSVESLIDDNWEDVKRTERAVIVAPLKEANCRDRRFGELLARWRGEPRRSDREEAVVMQELERKRFTQVTPR
jgi:hypothetical protein